jgi:Fn3 associated
VKAVPLFMCFAFALARTAAGQAFGETIQLSQPSVQKTGAATTVPTSPLNSSSGLPQQGGVQVVQNTYAAQVDCHCAQPPTFLPGPREVAPGTPVILTSSNPNAVIHYTTEGWTPTDLSAVYVTPININSNTLIQAFAVEPGKAPSPIVAASYTISGPAVSLAADVSISGAALPKGTQIRLQTGNRVTSATANPGDHFYVLLDQNLVVNGKTLAPRGMSVDAVITSVKPAGQNGVSGVIVFKLTTISAHGVAIPLDGQFKLVAPDIGSQMNHISDTSFVRVSGPMPPGNEAKIEPGMLLTASVASDVPVNQ